MTDSTALAAAKEVADFASIGSFDTMGREKIAAMIAKHYASRLEAAEHVAITAQKFLKTIEDDGTICVRPGCGCETSAPAIALRLSLRAYEEGK